MKRHPRTFKGYFEWREALGLPVVSLKDTDKVFSRFKRFALILSLISLSACSADSIQTEEEPIQDAELENLWYCYGESRYTIYNFSYDTYTRESGIYDVGTTTTDYTYEVDGDNIISIDNNGNERVRSFLIEGDSLFYESKGCVKL